MKDRVLKTHRGERIPTGIKVAYGAAEGSSAIFYALYSIFYMIFMTDVLGISASLAGIIIFVSHIWDALTDIGMGVLSDRTKSRFGRRRPYILGAALPFGILIWMMFSSPALEVNGIMQATYYVVILMLVFLSWTVYAIPYTAMTPEMTSNYNERTSLSSYKVVWAMVGAAVGSALPLAIVEEYADPQKGWEMVGFSFGIVCFVLILTTWRFTSGWERGSIDRDKLRFRDIVDAVVQNKPFRYVVGIYIFSMSFVYGFEALIVYYLEYYMKLSGDEISIFFLVMFSSSVFWVPFITYTAKRIGKNKAYAFFIGSVSIISSVGYMVIQPGQVYFLYFLALIGGNGMAAAYELVWAMIADVTEIEEFKTGKRREGLYYGVIMLLHKGISAVSMLLIGFYLDWIKYIPNLEQSEEVLFGLRIIQGPVSGGIYFVAAIIALIMPLTPKTYAALLKAIEAKKAGKTWDAESIEKII